VDIERTLDRIATAQAKAEARMDAMDARYAARMDAMDARSEAMDARLKKRIDATTKLIQAGMKMLVKYKADTDRNINALIESQFRLDEEMAALAASQRITDRKFQAFMDSLRKGGNGRDVH